MMLLALGLTLGLSGVASAHNPCNPCAMKDKMMKHNPCKMNPCEMKKHEMMKHNPCKMNPCEMKKHKKW